MRFTEQIDNMQSELICTLQRLIAIPSVEKKGEAGTPYGVAVKKCLEEALKIGEELGFRTQNMDDIVGWCEIGEGPEMVAVLGHLDVVPEMDGWTHGAFSGEVVGNRIYGRGTTDDKGPVVASMYALKAILDAGVPLKRRIRILMGTNEETGCEDMKYYLANGGEVPVMGFTPDGEYPLINGEKGIISETYTFPLQQTGEIQVCDFSGGVADNVVPNYAKAVLICPKDLEFPEEDGITVTRTENGAEVWAKGQSAHGSLPQDGINAIGRLMIYLNRLPLVGDLKKAVSFLAEKIGMEYNGQGFGVDLEDELSGHTSFNLGVLFGDEKNLGVKINYRYPVTFCFEDCGPKVRKAFEEQGFVLGAKFYKDKLYVPKEEPLVQKLLGVYRDATGDTSEPKCIGGGTYAKEIPNIVAFGCMFDGDPVVEHCPDEFITIENLMINTKIIANAMAALAEEE